MKHARGAAEVVVAAAIVAAAGCKVSKIESRGITDGGPACAVFVSHAVDSRFSVDGALVVPQGCDVTLDGDVVVGAKGTLTLEKGVTLRFGSGKTLEVDGVLVTKGTAELPVTLTSAAPAPAPGDWEGVLLHAPPGPVGAPPPATSVLTHTRVAYAGPRSSSSFSGGCVTVGEGTSIEVTSSTIEHCKTAGLSDLRAPGGLRAFSDVTLRDDGISLDVAADALGVVKGGRLGDPVHVHGNVTRSQTWRVDVPIVVSEPLAVESAGVGGAAAVLELAEGTKLAFTHEGTLRVGSTSAGSVVARHATFTSAADKPAPGDWQGLELGDHAGGSRIGDSTIEYAGRRPYARTPAVALRVSVAKGSPVELKGLTFRETEKSGVAVRIWPSTGAIDCAAIGAAGNRSLDTPLCATN